MLWTSLSTILDFAAFIDDLDISVASTLLKRFEKVWQNYVYALKDTYEMKP